MRIPVLVDVLPYNQFPPFMVIFPPDKQSVIVDLLTSTRDANDFYCD